MGLTARRRTSCRSGHFLHTLLLGRQLDERVGRCQRKIAAGQRQGLVNTHPCIPQRGQQHFAAPAGISAVRPGPAPSDAGPAPPGSRWPPATRSRKKEKDGREEQVTLM